MVVEVVELEPGRQLVELAACLERHGGALVVLKWRPGEPTLADLLLPDDDARKATCRRILDEWRRDIREQVTAPAGSSWPLGHPRHQFVLPIG
jgi:hypothetical protein